jgi:hypothetical protein
MWLRPAPAADRKPVVLTPVIGNGMLGVEWSWLY